MVRLGRDCLIALLVDATVRMFFPTLLPLLPVAWFGVLIWLTLDLLRSKLLKKPVQRCRSQLAKWHPVATYLTLFCIGGAILCLYWLVVTKGLAFGESVGKKFSEKRTEPEPPVAKDKLTVSVQDFGYDDSKQQLETTVAFNNRDSVTRAIVAVHFFCRTKEQKVAKRGEMTVFMKDEERQRRRLPFASTGDPEYVPPGSPRLKSYSAPVDPELLNVAGNVFGLLISTLNANGSRNVTTIEIMALIPGGTATGGLARGWSAPGVVSLDEPWRNVDLEFRLNPDEALTLASSTPTVVPSPTAKSVLDRIKIRDTPDGAILEVENLPTSTPQPEPTVAALNPNAVKAQDEQRASSRQLTKRTPQELLGLYDGRTGLQGDKLMEPYIGLWIEVTGEVHSLVPDNEGSCAVLRLEPDSKMVDCRFEKRWRADLDRVNNKDKIRVLGKLRPHQNGQVLMLQECELLN